MRYVAVCLLASLILTAPPASAQTAPPGIGLPCSSRIAVNQTTATDLKTLTDFGYICSIILISATAQNFSLVEGTGSVCATGETAIIGGTTASVAVSANGGFFGYLPVILA